MTNNLTHATVLQFLLQQGYTDTAQSFKREASEYFDASKEENAFSLENVVDKTSDLLSNLQLESHLELESGDDDFFTLLSASFTTIHNNNILAVAVEPQTHVIATSSTDKAVKLSYTINKQDGNTSKVCQHHQAPVLSIDFHPTLPHLMLTTSMDGTSILVNTQNVDEVHQHFKDHKKYVIRGLFSPGDGKYIATASFDRTVCIYRQQTAESLPSYTLIKQMTFLNSVEAICFFGDTLVVGVRDDNYLHYIGLPDFHEERCNINANGDDWVSFSPAWLSPSPDGRYLLCSTDHESGRMIMFAWKQSKQIQNYYDAPTDNKFSTRRHAFHPSGKYFYASGGDDNSIRVFEAKSGNVVAHLKGHTAMVRAMTLDAELGLVTGGYDHAVRVWSKASQTTKNST
ncbi:hypothetical protein DFQ28_001959 [Apophysomyces sp. BC1034]|nr:hypothetical protein DFQ30_002316 [Apophysomyces sp. BC1015]KAG0179969.1 hypothetical protein DFQ29_001414 [Apophysomyces sp. BC1021]KAG0190520.1 hypothetical protein DFQ28_001959 [Apophysomyces sp. BC1034]